MGISGAVYRLASVLGLAGRQGQRFDWPTVEASLGLKLPDDYKQLIEIFPDGRFQGLIRPIRPGQNFAPETEYLGTYAHQLEDMRRSGNAFPHPIYPEPGGLLPWAVGNRARMLFWLTEGDDPNGWPVVITDFWYGEWRTIPGTASDFLVELVEGRFDAGILGVDQMEQEPWLKLIGNAPTAQSFKGTLPLWNEPGAATDEFAQLADLIGPPSKSVKPYDWKQIEAELFTALPSDYKRFLDTYGPGAFCDIRISAADGPDQFNLQSLLHRWYGEVRQSGMQTPPVYPETGGMIAWGDTAGGSVFGWAPVAPEVDHWGVVVVDPPGLVTYSANLSFTSLLRKLAESDPSVTNWLGREAPSEAAAFIPAL